MVNEIKELKLIELKKQLQVYERMKKQKEQLEQQLNDLNKEIQQKNQLIPYRKFNWFQKHILQRKEYKTYISENGEVSQEIKKLQNRRTEIVYQISNLTIQYNARLVNEIQYQMHEIAKAKTLQELGISIEEAMHILEEHNIPCILGQEDKNITPHNRDYKGLEDLILVHKTRFAPTQSRIKTTKESQVIVTKKLILDGKEYEYSYQRERNTVHFSVNDEVSSHMYGQWEDTKYAVLIPFVDIPKESIGSAVSVDTFTMGGVELTQNSWILCPKGEKEELVRKNPKVKVIEYEGKYVKDYAPGLLSALGYRNESVSMWSWSDVESQKQYDNIMKEQGLEMVPHSFTQASEDEHILENINQLVSIFSTIKRNQLIKTTEDIKHIEEQLNDNKLFCFPTFEGIIHNAIIQNPKKLPILYDRLAKEGIAIPQELQSIFRNILKIKANNYYMPRITMEDIITEDINVAQVDKSMIEYLRQSIQNSEKDNLSFLEGCFQRMVLTEIEEKANTLAKENLQEKKNIQVEK